MKLTDAEWKIMRAVWKRNPASARDVMEQTEGEADWAYTTVKTMLARLVEKGALKSRLRANTTLYEPLISEKEARRSALRSILDTAFDGAFGPLLHFLLAEEKLSRRDREQLKRLIDEQEPKGEKK